MSECEPDPDAIMAEWYRSPRPRPLGPRWLREVIAKTRQCADDDG